MSDSDLPFSSGAPTWGPEPLRTVQDVTARAQRLIDTPRPAGGHLLDWHVEAMHVGDLTAIAITALRSPASSSTR